MRTPAPNGPARASAIASKFAGHYAIGFGDGAAATTEVAAWRAAYEHVPRTGRHIDLHTGHIASVNEVDRPFVNGAGVDRCGLALDEAAWRMEIDRTCAAGVTEMVSGRVVARATCGGASRCRPTATQ